MVKKETICGSSSTTGQEGHVQQQLVQKQQQQHGGGGGGGVHYRDALKIFVSRIPVHFDEDSVRRLVEEKLQKPTTTAIDDHDKQNNEERSGDDVKADKQEEESSSVVVAVELVYPNESSNKREHNDDDHKNSTGEEGHDESFNTTIKQKKNDADGGRKSQQEQQQQQQQHKGYGFVVLQTEELVQQALALGRLRGGAKPTSTRKNYTIYIGPCLTDEEKMNSSNNSKNDDKNPQVCFLWTASGCKHCPYGKACKFQHIGGDASAHDDEVNEKEDKEKKKKKKKRIKCRDYRKNKCKLSAEECPYSHDFEPNIQAKREEKVKELSKRLDSEKDCISWKTKGKCRKATTTCPYRHDESVQMAALEKVAARKRKRQYAEQQEEQHHDKKSKKTSNSNSKKKVKQPLSVRVFGMSYDTTRADVQRAFAGCGKISSIDFPVFDDASRRSKGYCSVTFCSPKAVEQAVRDLDGHEEKQRWWRVQAGKMLLDQWE